MATALAHPTTDPISADAHTAAKTAKTAKPAPADPTPPTDPTPTPIRADLPHLLTPAAQQRQLLQDRAWELYCQGERSPTIAAELGVPARTVRDWLRAIRTQLAPVSQQQRAEQQSLAVERQRSVLAAAWEGFHTDRERQEQLYQGAYDHLTRRTTRPASASAPSVRSASAAKTATTIPASPASPASPAAPAQILDERYARPRDTTHPVQYLRLALSANREMARLLGLYDRQPRAASTTPIVPDPTTASAASATPAESAAAAKTAKIATKAAAKTAPPDATDPATSTRTASTPDYPRPSGRELPLPPSSPSTPIVRSAESAASAESATASAAKTAKTTTKAAAKTAKKAPALTHRQRRVAAPPRRSKEGRRLRPLARPIRE
ncbi:MAG: hypothetical protein OJF49_004054 [Ktedonobacterales bacterium]|nr:MAG: hypothetical protein OJF49_004054 [Ktedonobacterales bacterium]